MLRDVRNEKFFNVRPRFVKVVFVLQSGTELRRFLVELIARTLVMLVSLEIMLRAAAAESPVRVELPNKLGSALERQVFIVFR